MIAILKEICKNYLMLLEHYKNMTTKKKETRGKPPRYPGEKSERISVLVRPRYRQALDIIAKDRGTTLSEAMELAISILARETKLQQEFYDKEAPHIIDYVRPKIEPVERLYRSIPPMAGVLYKFDITEKTNTYDDIINKLYEIPDPLLTPLQNHIGETIHELNGKLHYFSPVYLSEALEEDWKEGIPSDVTARNIEIVHNFYEEVYLEKFFELNPMISPDSNLDEIKNYLKNATPPFNEDDFEEDSLISVLKEYYDQNY